MKKVAARAVEESRSKNISCTRRSNSRWGRRRRESSSSSRRHRSRRRSNRRGDARAGTEGQMEKETRE